MRTGSPVMRLCGAAPSSELLSMDDLSPSSNDLSASSVPAQGALSDEDLARAVVRERLATSEEVDRCVKEVARQPDGAQRTLLEILISAQAITPNQARRVLQSAAKPGNQIPGFQLLNRIGQGSMG